MSRVTDILSRARTDVLPPDSPEPGHEGARERTRPAAIVRPPFLPLPPPPSPRGELVPLALRLFQVDHTRVRSVVFTSIGARHDSLPLCAWTALELIAQPSVRVCVVDADFERPTLQDAFGLAGGSGLSDALFEGRDPSGLSTRVAGTLWFLPAGSRGAAARPHLSGEPFRAMLRNLSTAFDYVLVQTTPADAAFVGARMDGVVLVVQANATRRWAARRAVAQLKAANVRVLGAVLTHRTYPIPESIYRWL